MHFITNMLGYPGKTRLKPKSVKVLTCIQKIQKIFLDCSFN